MSLPLISILIMGIVSSSIGPAFGVDDSQRRNFFNVELLQKLNEANPGNVVVGTSSIKASLMVLAAAAAFETREEIVSALRLPVKDDQLKNLASQIFDPIKDSKGGVELQSVVKLWVQLNQPVKREYLDALQSIYKGEFEKINFADPTSINIINEWVKKNTHGRLDSIIDSDLISHDVKMVLTSAVYFKGKWLNAFDKDATRRNSFFVPNYGPVTTEMMETYAIYNHAYIPALKAQVIQIPYEGNRLSMLVFLPKFQGEARLAGLSRDLSFLPISAVLASLEKTQVLLRLPRFKIENKLDLSEPLEKMGIRQLFSQKANLSAAFPPTKDLKVDKVVHNAQIEVNEEGTTAVASTGASVIPLMGSTATAFFADRPFIFMVFDHQTHNILFAGRFFKPEID